MNGSPSGPTGFLDYRFGGFSFFMYWILQPAARRQTRWTAVRPPRECVCVTSKVNGWGEGGPEKEESKRIKVVFSRALLERAIFLFRRVRNSRRKTNNKPKTENKRIIKNTTSGTFFVFFVPSAIGAAAAASGTQRSTPAARGMTRTYTPGDRIIVFFFLIFFHFSPSRPYCGGLYTYARAMFYCRRPVGLTRCVRATTPMPPRVSRRRARSLGTFPARRAAYCHRVSSYTRIIIIIYLFATPVCVFFSFHSDDPPNR